MSRLRIIWNEGKRLIFVLLILFISFVFAMFQGGFVSWFIFYSILPFTIYSLLFYFYPLSKMEVERTLKQTKISSGGKLAATIVVKRKSSFPLIYLVVSENTNSPFLKAQSEGRMKHFILLGFKKEFEWTYEVDNMQRGEHFLEGIDIECNDFFGWVKKKSMIPLTHRIIVYPPITEILYMPVETQYDQGTAVSPFTLVKDTTMATGTRDYHPGDRVSWIHWKSFARTQTLRTKEFEDRQSQDLFLIMDRQPADAFEETVGLTASILQAAVRHQATVGFLSSGMTRTYFPSIQSEEHLQRVHYHLAKVQADLLQPIELVYVGDQALAKASSILLITANLTPNWIDTLSKSANNIRSCTIFVVRNKESKPSKKELAIHQLARSRGMNVRVLSQAQFPNAFTEVNR